MEYKDYLEKANEVLANEFGIGVGTFAYKQTDKSSIINTLILMELVKDVNELKEMLKNKEVEVEATKATVKKATKK